MVLGRRREGVRTAFAVGLVAVVAFVLAQLRARRNWYRIVREWVYADPPATELGELEWEYFESRGVSRTPGIATT